MIDIEITEKFRLRSDKHGYMLCKSQKDKRTPDEITWSGFKFYSDIRSVMSHLPEYLIRQDDITSLSELVARLNAWQDYLKAQLEA